MRRLLYSTAFLGATGVIAGAFGAHALNTILTQNKTLTIWNTAVLYHLVHIPALLAAALYVANNSAHSAWLIRAATCWMIGILLFSGSLYALALDGPKWLGPVTPLGGLFLIAGWLCVAGAAGKKTKNPPSTKE